MEKRFETASLLSRCRACSLSMLLFFCVSNVHGQAVQVAQRKLSKNVSTSGLNRIVLGSEKADISIQAWNKEEIKVDVVLTARHSDKSLALRDLEKVQLVLNKDRKSYIIRDFILLKAKDEKPEANLKASYLVYAPAHIALDIQGAFGTVTVKGFSSQVNLKANFCEINLEQISGKTELNTDFGKLIAQELSGNLDLETNHTQVVLRKVGGDLKLTTHYGSLVVEPGIKLSSLNLRLKKTSVDLICPEWRKYRYAISGAYTRFKLPEGFDSSGDLADKQEINYAGTGKVPVIVSAEFGDLTIR